MKRFLRLPSPAMVVALIALFAATGGVSYAVATGSIDSREIKNNTVRSKDVRTRGLVGTDFKKNSLGGNAVKESSLGTVPGASVAAGSSLYAVVNQNGSSVRNRSLVSATRVGAGVYSVTFNRAVSSCGYYATLGDEGIDSPPAGEVGVSTLASNPAGVRVVTRNSAGNTANRSFHLIVSC